MAEQDLKTELETYQKELPSLLTQEGKYVLIHDGSVLGTFEAYSDALSQGYEKVGLKPFLVKKIASVETAAYFTRDISRACT